MSKCWNEKCSNFRNYLSACKCTKPDKGQKNGSCNRQGCQEPGATWYNHVMRAWYCPECARRINASPFGTGEPLCKPDPELCKEEIEYERQREEFLNGSYKPDP